VNVDALRFAGEVSDADGVTLGEARLWACAERSSDGASWRGWLNIADLARPELAAGRYRVRAPEGWEAEFEPLVARPGRIFETDLLPIIGVGEPPWPDASEEPGPRYVPVWGDSPPRSAHDPCRMGDLPPLQLEAAESGAWLTESRIETE
jgi:hypothetical protein